MKFKLNLDEALFNDDVSDLTLFDGPLASSSLEFDDDYSDDSHGTADVLPGPSNGTGTGVASEVIRLINDEWEAIEGYNNAIATFRSVSSEDPVYLEAVNVLEEIVSEENRHVGQLQEVLRRISPNAAEIDKGVEEAKSQLGFVGGVLPVQSWESSQGSASSVADTENNMCTLFDTDDEM